MQDSVYIIIVTYNGMEWLPKCLNSTIPYPVIIVDNNSTDGIVSFVKEKYPSIVLLKQKKNLGFGQANNIGISYALNEGADYVFLLNQDTYLQSNCIKKLVKVHNQNELIGVLSPIHLNGKGKELDLNFLMYLNRYGVTNSILCDGLTKDFRSIYYIDFVNAAAWLVPRKILEIVGGFDPIFHHYGEDRNYCQRVAYHGYSVAIVPEAIVFHDRQNRKRKQPSLYSRSYYQEFERYLKVDFGNINKENFDERYNEKIRFHKYKHLKNLLLFRFKEARDSLKKRKILVKLKPELLKSRKRNMSKYNF